MVARMVVDIGREQVGVGRETLRQCTIRGQTGGGEVGVFDWGEREGILSGNS